MRLRDEDATRSEEFDDAVDQSERLLADLHITEFWTSLQRAEAHLIAGSFDSARAELTQTSSLLQTLGKPERIWATGLDAFHRLRTGEVQAAHELL